jgi:hypothetical protein
VTPTARMHPDLAARPRSSGQLRFRVPPAGVNDTPVVEHDFLRDLILVRIRRDVHKTKAAFYMGSPLVMVEDIYLDGTHVRQSYTEDRKHQIEDERKIMSAENTIRAARTKDTIDFGRFEQACVALMTQIDQVKAAKGSNDDAQEEIIFRGYQGILAWRAELERQVSAVDGAIDVVAAKLRDMVQ